MKHLIYTQVDRFTGVPVSEAPAFNGPASPNVPGLTFGFALESEYPTDTPTFYGTAPDEAGIGVPGILSAITQSEYNDAHAAEIQRRLDLRRTAKLSAINARVETVLSSGFTVPTGVMAGKLLQTRDSTDRINWLVSQASYSEAVNQGAGGLLSAKFRTADNETFILSCADGLAVLLDMAAWGAAAMDRSWALKDAVAAAADSAALDAIDIDSGWPA